MFLCVNSVDDKDKLTRLGFKYVTSQILSGKNIYIFKDNKEINFEKEKVKIYKTNKLYF